MKILVMLSLCLVAVAMVSGCIADDAADYVGKVSCELNGGLWLEDYNECCPKGCPALPPDRPYTAAEEALVTRCNSCWLI